MKNKPRFRAVIKRYAVTYHEIRYDGPEDRIHDLLKRAEGNDISYPSLDRVTGRDEDGYYYDESTPNADVVLENWFDDGVDEQELTTFELVRTDHVEPEYSHIIHINEEDQKHWELWKYPIGRPDDGEVIDTSMWYEDDMDRTVLEYNALLDRHNLPGRIPRGTN